MKQEGRRYYGGAINNDGAAIIILNSHINLKSVSEDLKALGHKKVHIVCGIWYTIETPKQLAKTLFIYFRNKLYYPSLSVSFLANTQKEYKYLRMFGIPAVYCNQNCFVDERIFTIENKERRYAAIYNAVLLPFKRQVLCSKLRNIAFVTYNFANHAYKAFLDSNLSEVSWLNYGSDGSPRFLDDAELASAYNVAKVGLALSSIEGAMYASNEYLFCGLPVVSVKSLGGRDVFYNKKNSVIVESTPDGVKAGVEELIAKQYDPEAIRNDVLNQVQPHRERFINHINSIMRSFGKTYDLKEFWESWFVHKLRHHLTVDEMVRKDECQTVA